VISLEQVQLLESKVAKAIEYVERVTDENTVLSRERVGLIAKLDANQKRLGELELLVMRFKEDQGRIEDGIIAALNRLSQFEEAFESSLSEKAVTKKTSAKKEKSQEKAAPVEPAKTAAQETQEDGKEFFEITAGKDDDSLSNENELDIF
jgi:hypothetical protein